MISSEHTTRICLPENVKEHNIKIFNARGVYSTPMAEFAISGVHACYKKLPFFLKNQAAHVWEKYRGVLELSGKTVCIVGCGSVGTECAKRFSAFSCRVIGADLFPYENPCFEKMYPISELDALLPECDVLVLTLPLTDETRHMMDASRFAKMKESAND